MAVMKIKELSEQEKLYYMKQGYKAASIKLGKDPICPYLPATAEYRAWQKGWKQWADDQIEKERKQNNG